ncbi:hypothetical protein T4A_10936 [Trichinella pseudospiralis]|uniref:Uncharacterized protein n=1 Tax=Trichinella pseudospiralis TaxID=6337 RepID=A0A0V1K2F5_TRIPS|nr:hypothetical protein T4A_10936 [Trichinella pseudospiralis]KRZ41408.1 hypothetical protein T4C_3056 [Trichinella pseudospiralis]
MLFQNLKVIYIIMEQPLKDDVVSKVEDTLNHLIEEVTELLDNEDSLNKENVSMQVDDTDDEQSSTEIKPSITLNVEQRLLQLLLKSYDLLIFAIAQQFRIVSEEIERARGGLAILLKDCEVSFEQFNELIHSEHLEKQVNLMYEYVGVWKVEGFLIPDLKPNDLVTVLRNLPDPKSFYETMKVTVMLLLCLRRDDYVGKDSHVLSVRKTRTYLKFLLHQRELLNARMKSLCHEKIYQSVINDSSENEISRQTCTLCTSYQCCFRCSDELMQHRENALSSTKLSTNGNASVISNIVNDLVIYKYVKELSNWISDKKDVQCSLDKDSRSILKIPAPKRSGGSARPEEVENNKNSKQRKESLMKIRLGLLQRCQKSASESETSSSLKKSTKKSSRKLSLITSEENSSS